MELIDCCSRKRKELQSLISVIVLVIVIWLLAIFIYYYYYYLNFFYSRYFFHLITYYWSSVFLCFHSFLILLCYFAPNSYLPSWLWIPYFVFHSFFKFHNNLFFVLSILYGFIPTEQDITLFITSIKNHHIGNYIFVFFLSCLWCHMYIWIIVIVFFITKIKEKRFLIVFRRYTYYIM